jgi:hypothetical protein
LVPDESQIHRVTDRLPRAELDEIIAAYQSGESAPAIAKRHGISRTSVLNLAADAGVPRHMTHMDETEQAEAIRLYQSGLSLAAVGKRLNRSSFSILGALRRNGVPTRKR